MSLVSEGFITPGIIAQGFLSASLQTVEVDFFFPSDTQGFSETSTAGIWSPFTWNGADGSPANGCIEFASTDSFATFDLDHVETPAGRTWEYYGVPTGAVVTSVQLTAYSYKTPNFAGVIGADHTIKMITGASTAILAGNLAYNSASSAGWTTVGAGTQQSVLASYQASNTAVKFVIETSLNSGAAANYKLRIDTLRVLITFTGGSLSYSVTPTTQSYLTGQYGIFTISMDYPADGAGQIFLLTDAGAGGLFQPSIVTIPAGQSTANFSYRNTYPGNFSLTVYPFGGMLSGFSSQTVIANILYGGAPVAAVLNPSDVIWGVGYLTSTLNAPDDVPFGILQEISLKDSYGTKELMGPEQLSALAVGYTDRKITGSAKWGKVRAAHFLKARGGTRALQTAVVSPVAFTPTPTPAVTGGNITVTGGNLVIGVAYSWASAYGQTLISPVTAVTFASAAAVCSVALTLLTPPAGATLVNWYTTSTGYANAGLAQAAPLYFNVQNTGAAWTMTTLGAITAPGIPANNSIGIARTAWTAAANDEAPLFNLHLKNPSDGSQAELYLYGIIAPDLSISIKTRDFVIPDMSFNVYGNSAVTPYTMYTLLLPGDQSVI